MRFIIILFAIYILNGCQNKNEFEDYFSVNKVCKKDILFISIELDSISLEKVESSYTGYLNIYADSIYFTDNRFCWVFVFDKEGKLQGRHLGQGRGPFEISTKFIDSFLFLTSGDKMFLGSTLDFHVFNKNWQRIRQFRINRERNDNVIDKVNNLSVDDPLLYTLDYEKLILHANSKGDIFIPIYSEHSDFNGFSTMDYYKEGRILAKLDIESGSIQELLGRRSPEYLKYRYLGHHSFFSFDISNNDFFYISHEIDSTIYVYNNDFEIQYAFGCSGKEMDTDYQECKRFDRIEIQRLYFNDRPKRGYYNNISLFDEKELLFRSYKKSISSLYDGLQIYKNMTLIADVNVPKDFSVIGYIDPFFYSGIIDEDNETITVYRFKLDI